MGIRITTDDKGPVKVWRSDDFGFPTYAIAVSKKDGDHFINKYQEVRFRKGVELENGEKIYITDAFPTLSTWVKDGKQHMKIIWFVMSFKRNYDDAETVEEYNMRLDDMPDSFAAAEEDVPF